MKDSQKKHRWFVLGISFAFMLFHQADKLLIGPLTSSIMESFKIDEFQMGAVVSGALVVGTIFYPLWGYLYDRFTRPKLLALASLLWGCTTWLSAIAPNFKMFTITRSSTGIDDSSYPGIYSLLGDYFPPKMRGKVYGILQFSQPIGYLLGMILALLFSGVLGWRSIFYITGSLGVVLAIIIFFTVKEVPRGQSEPALEGMEDIAIHRFELKHALELIKKRSMWLLFVQGFVGVFPWQVITYWFFRYLEVERNYDENAIMMTMVPVVLVLGSGYIVGGMLGDWAFKRTKRGRLLVAMGGVLIGAILLNITLIIPVEQKLLFGISLAFMALFIPIASPNVVSTVNDIALPEVRSTALSIQYFIENSGAALAPLLAGYIAREASLKSAILWICVTAWVLGAASLGGAAYLIPKDIADLREQMQARAVEV
ncbi:MAG: MFS transporter [Chloroflexota bacterium]|nr:MAG: MFS transporter [Chloroflexota bacterium]